MNGYRWAAASIVLITVAQLLMKWGVGQLTLSWPVWPAPPALWLDLLHQPEAALWCIAGGVACYLLSMLCWMGVLYFLPLSFAYPLLSLSYVLVSLAAAALPWFREPLTLSKVVGTLLILLGVGFIGQSSNSNSNSIQ